jgi:nicotinate phosphoribosyltransferase
MPFKVTPTGFRIGPTIEVNKRPVVTEETRRQQDALKRTVNYRREPLKAWVTQTDLYQLVMANLFHQICGRETPTAHFEVFIRKLPGDRDFMTFSGLHDVLHWLSNAKMDQGRIDFVMQQPIIRESVSDLKSFRKYLEGFAFDLDVWAYPEGSFYMPMTPYLGISGPLEKVLLAETFILSILNSRSAFSTRAAQYRLANPGMGCIAMEMRRMDPELSEIASFEAWKQGFIGTSNVEAAYQYGITPIGTNSHAMYMAFDSEIEAIAAWMKVYPNNPMVLTDTYHTLINALKTVAVLKASGFGSVSFRVDSGYLGKLMEMYETIMWRSGIETKLRVGTNDLTPLALAEMLEQQCNANAAGVGTKFGEVPATPGVYKLSQIDGPDGARFACKLSAGGKATLPGSHQIWRRFDGSGRALGDTVALLDEEVSGAVPLLRPFMSDGQILSPYPSKDELRKQFELGRGQLFAAAPYPVTFTPRTLELKEQVIREIRAREIDPYRGQLSAIFTPEELAEVAS